MSFRRDETVDAHLQKLEHDEINKYLQITRSLALELNESPLEVLFLEITMQIDVDVACMLLAA